MILQMICVIMVLFGVLGCPDKYRHQDGHNRKLRKRKPAIQIFYRAWLEQSADVNHHVLVKLNNAPLPRTLVAEIDITVLAHPLELFKCGLDVEGIIIQKL